MEKEFKIFIEGIVIATIRKRATMEAIASLHANKKYAQSLIGWIIGIILLVTVSVYFSIWWLFIPVSLSYVAYDYIRKFRYVRGLVPNILDGLILEAIEEMSESLKDDVEDLQTKTAMKLYNEEDIGEKKSNIMMLEVSLKALKELHKEIKLELCG